MSSDHHADLDLKSPPFDRLKHVRPLGADRSGRGSESVRHHLLEARDKETGVNVLVKLTAKPGLVYEHNLTNEAAALATINRELPTAPYFPLLRDRGRLRDGRLYLVISLFDEFPLATAIGAERVPGKTVAYIRAALEVASALTELHGLGIFHVDLNPMNILYRVEKGSPIIRIVDFESAYERSRHEAGETYNPATTTGYTAPEIPHRNPDARADVFSLGAVLYTMLAGFEWTLTGMLKEAIAADRDIDAELRSILAKSAHEQPDRRYATAAAFREALGAYLESIWPGRAW